MRGQSSTEWTAFDHFDAVETPSCRMRAARLNPPQPGECPRLFSEVPATMPGTIEQMRRRFSLGGSVPIPPASTLLRSRRL